MSKVEIAGWTGLIIGLFFGWIAAKTNWHDVFTHKGWCDECCSAPNECECSLSNNYDTPF